jgi:hypothetical protein
MKKTIILFLTFWVLHACTEPYDTVTFYELINNSEHKIKIFTFHPESTIDSLTLHVGDIKQYWFSRKAIVAGVPFGGDSLWVTFNDTVSITHYRLQEQLVNRNLFSIESWSGGKVNDLEYRYEYIFTNAGYQEALNNQEN